MQRKFKIAAAQITSVRGAVAKNLETHAIAIETAAQHEIDVLIFPELSLTGYEPDLADSLGYSEADEWLQTLSSLASRYHIILIAGAPLRLKNARPHIGALVFSTSGAISSYSKMYLHPGEEEFFSAGSKPCVLHAESERVGVAICADVTHGDHPAMYAELGASIYAGSVFITTAGYAADSALLQDYAHKHDMLVIIANYNGPTGGFVSAGKSAVWAPGGELIAMAGHSENALVIATRDAARWSGTVLVY